VIRPPLNGIGGAVAIGFWGESGVFQVSLKAKLDMWICAACKGIIEGHDGSIRAEGEVGMRRIFVIVL
jgi:hypothetical protein